MAYSKIRLNGTTLMDVTQKTVAANNLLSGETALGADGLDVVGTLVPSSGGGSSKSVNFYDYDGTIVNSYTVQEAQALSALPANPSHTGLTAQGWNWSLADIKSYLTNHPDGIVNVGQMYITASGATEIDVTFDDPDYLSPYLMISPNGTVEIDWGDNSSTDTVTGTSTTSQKFTQHTYSQIGSYTIKLTVTSGSFGFYNNSSSYASILRISDQTSTVYTYSSIYSICVKSIRLGNNAIINSSAFSNCYSLTSVTIPNTVTSIGGNAFSGCYSLTSVTIPNTVTSIGSNAFYNCYSLTSLTIPNTVTSIGNQAFQNCYSLTSITIPNTVTSIGSSAFYYCYSLTSITIPNTVTSIGNSAFNSCYSLTSLTIPNTVTSIGDGAFNSCYSLTSLTIPSGCTVGRNAFQGCALFTSLPVPLPSDATDIKASEFSGCYSLTSVTIPNTVTSIGSSAFYNCYSLTSLTIPNTVTSIGSSAFSNCRTLTSLTIPDGVTTIGNSAFSFCYSMLEYHFLSTTPPTLGGSSVFNSIPSDCIIYVPYSADHSILTAYQTASNWSAQASKMQEEPQT